MRKLHYIILILMFCSTTYAETITEDNIEIKEKPKTTQSRYVMRAESFIMDDVDKQSEKYLDIFDAPALQAPSIVKDKLVTDFFDRTIPTVDYEKIRAQGYIDAKAENDTVTMEALSVNPTVEEILSE